LKTTRHTTVIFDDFRVAFMQKTIFLTAIFLYCICSPNKPSPGISEKGIAGMRAINASGKTFTQGAADQLAGLDEKPPMQSGFAHNYWIDTTEVTQAEYFEVMGKRPVADTSISGVGDRNPVYNVSWFDAVLFCNAKSKKLDLDTVYSYSGAPQTQSGSVYNLFDVHIHYERGGIRLPTEAEWEYAAREATSLLPFPHLGDSGSAQAYAWYSANAGGLTRAVATRIPNALGIYDMAGNVFEWTGDWKGYYNGRAIVDGIGALQPNTADERVVKGGSFKTGFSCLRPSHREAIYATSQSAPVEYIGFRCAYGIISAVFFIETDSGSRATNSTSLVVSDVGSFLGGKRARLVFVNVTDAERTLCYVDFSRSYPYIYEFKDCDTVYKPVISPNGRYVAFSTRGDGSPGLAHIYVRNLDSLTALSAPIRIASDSAFGPRWWVDPATRDTFLLYTNSAIDNTLLPWSQSSTLMVKMSGAKAAGTPQRIAAGGGFYGGRSVSGRYLISGYRSLLLQDLTAQRNRQLFLSPLNGKGLNGSVQVCNVSMSPDTGQGCRMLFLDFGYPPPSKSTLTGGSYGVHEYLFVCNDSGLVTRWYESPAAEASWDNPQWSNAAGLAVSCARDGADRAHAVYAMNLHDSAYLKMVEGVELAHPCLWKDPCELINSDSLDLDSLGMYDDPHTMEIQSHFAARMLAFWRHYKEMEIVFLGSSHTGFAVNPIYFSLPHVFNMAYSGGDFPSTKTMSIDYVLNYCPSIRLIGMDLIPGFLIETQMNFQWDKISSNKGYHYDQNHSFWKKGLPANFLDLMQQAPFPAITFDTLGSYRGGCWGWGGTAPDVDGGVWWSIDHERCQTNIRLIKDFVTILAQRNIHFLMYVTPESPWYRNTTGYGKYGASRQAGDDVVRYFTALQDSLPFFHFYDANLGGNHDYADSEANDIDHLCLVGGKKFSSRLDSVVRSILGQ